MKVATINDILDTKKPQKTKTSSGVNIVKRFFEEAAVFVVVILVVDDGKDDEKLSITFKVT